jgi:argininosuccinate lyase
LVSSLGSFIGVLVKRAGSDRGIIMPGYTHHQPAQVTSLGHMWLAFAEALVRDGERFREWYHRFNRNPLGSMTGYSTSFGIDRILTSKILGFDGPCENSLDPIQNRWEAEAELGFAVTVMMNHLSSLAETLILLSTEEFGMLVLDDSFCSGSSMMPQKRNPDPLEIIKAKASVAQGIIVSLTSIGRSLFLGYNRDTQWTKYLIMDLMDECLPAVEVMSGIIDSLKIKEERMAILATKGFIGAPDLVEKLVQDGNLPFRKAKIIVERAVRYTEAAGMDQVSSAALGKALEEEESSLKISERFVQETQEPEFIVSQRKTIGGTSRGAMGKNMFALRGKLKSMGKWLGQKRGQEERAKVHLAKLERNI